MSKVQHVGLDEVVGYFDALEDPRSTINQKHPLGSVVVMAMMAVLAGAAVRRRLPNGPSSKRSSF
jgi:hypothetical protein